MTSGPHTPEQSEKVQRLRIRFGRGAGAASIGHLELTRTWVNALEESGLTISYSQVRYVSPLSVMIVLSGADMRSTGV